MIRYQIEPTAYTFVKENRFLSFTENIEKNNGKNLCKNLSDKCNKHFLIMLITDALKTTSNRATLKTATTSGDLIDNKISD